MSFRTFHCGFHFLRHARCIRRGGAKHDLKIPIHELDCAYEMLESFLAGDPADKKQVRSIWIDIIMLERDS
jgi:hypothetical protein